MSEKYIRQNTNSYSIYKNSKNYGKFKNIDDAIFAREILIENSWQLNNIQEVYEKNNNYIITKIIDEKIHFIGKYKQKPTKEQIQKETKKYIRNPNGSKYGVNITRVFETFIIKKQIMGDEYIFGYYDNLEDASFVRNHLLDNMWNIDSFSKIMHDEETQTCKITDVISDKIYIIDTYSMKDDVNLEKSYQKFLSKITKHKHGLASHPYLDELTEIIPELEKRYNVKTQDETWHFTENISNPLTEVIFTLTPWQKIVYDSVEDSTFDEIKKNLIRYRSKNFDEKISKNLDELISLGLIEKNNGKYIKNK